MTMTCDNNNIWMTSLLEERLSHEDAEEAQKHLKGCLACRVQYEILKRSLAAKPDHAPVGENRKRSFRKLVHEGLGKPSMTPGKAAAGGALAGLAAGGIAMGQPPDILSNLDGLISHLTGISMQDLAEKGMEDGDHGELHHSDSPSFGALEHDIDQTMNDHDLNLDELLVSWGHSDPGLGDTLFSGDPVNGLSLADHQIDWDALLGGEHGLLPEAATLDTHDLLSETYDAHHPSIDDWKDGHHEDMDTGWSHDLL